MWKCTNCGNENSGRFCPKCGTKMPDEAVSVNYDSQAYNQSNVQQNSQSNVQQNNRSNNQTFVHSNQSIDNITKNKKKKSNKALIITLCAILVVAIIGAGTFAAIKILGNDGNKTEQTASDNKKPENEPDIKDEFIDEANYKTSKQNHSYKNEDGEILIEHYYELVTLDGDTEGIKKINEDLKKDMEAFIMDEDELSEFVTPYTDPEYPFFNNCETEVTQNLKGMLSVKYTTSWMMGGVCNVNHFGKTYDLNTGSDLMLSDLVSDDVDTFEQNLKDNTWAYLDSCYGDSLFKEAYDTIYDMELDEFSFCIDNDELVLMFHTYLLGPGAMGPVEYSTGIYLETSDKNSLPTLSAPKAVKKAEKETEETEISKSKEKDSAKTPKNEKKETAKTKTPKNEEKESVASKNNFDIKKWVEDNSDVLTDVFSTSFESSSGSKCDCTVTVSGYDMIFTVKIDGLNNIDDTTKALMQQTFDSMEGTLAESFQQVKEEEPALANLEGVIFNICEQDGDKIAVIDLELN